MNVASRSLQPLLLLALLALALPAGATVARFLSLEEHVASAELIVRARAGSERSFLSDQDGLAITALGEPLAHNLRRQRRACRGRDGHRSIRLTLNGSPIRHPALQAS